MNKKDAIKEGIKWKKYISSSLRPAALEGTAKWMREHPDEKLVDFAIIIKIQTRDKKGNLYQVDYTVNTDSTDLR